MCDICYQNPRQLRGERPQEEEVRVIDYVEKNLTSHSSFKLTS
jgi:hypothetical protein